LGVVVGLLALSLLLSTAGSAAAGELLTQARDGASKKTSQSLDSRPVSEAEAPVSAAYLYEGFVYLESHTHNATYTYAEGDTVRVDISAYDPDDWGYYLPGIRIWDTRTNSVVRSYWASEYVYYSDTGYADVDLTGLAVSSRRYRIEAVLWDDEPDSQYYEDAEWFYLNIVQHRVTAAIDQISPNPAVVGGLVSFSGHGSDTGGHGTSSYRWRSSIDGELSSEASFSTSALSPGIHTIYFSAMCSNGLWSPEVSRTLVVNSHDPALLTAVIDQITPNPVVAGGTVSFSGQGVDSLGHGIASYQWRSSKNGVLSSAAAFSTSGLSEGVHTIYFRVSCFDGTWSPEVSRTLTVKSKNAYVKSVSKSTGTWSRSWSKYRLSPSYTKLTISRSKSYVKITPYREHAGATIYMKINGGSYSRVSSKKVYVSRGKSKTLYIKCVPQAGSAYAKTYKIVVARRR